jgi:hypothetical protein
MIASVNHLAEPAARPQPLTRPRSAPDGDRFPGPAERAVPVARGGVAGRSPRPSPAAPTANLGNGGAAPLDLRTLLALQQERREAGEETNAQGLTEEEQRQVESLKRQDREVRRHEQAHAAAGGAYAGQPRFKYTSGPDGKRYAVGGHVSIDTSPVGGNPRATIRKMETVKRAALAPADPSPEDRAIAAKAEQLRREAQAELRQRRAEELEEKQQRKQRREAAQAGRAGADGRDGSLLRRAVGAYGAGPPGGAGASAVSLLA